MLTTIMDKITTYVLLFSVIGHCKLNTNPEEMGATAMVWVTMFIIDFMSTWFKVYSTYLAGLRTEIVSNAVETLVIALYRGNTLTGIFVDTTADLWIAAHLCQNTTNLPLRNFTQESYF
jgi:hypothetical protein